MRVDKDERPDSLGVDGCKERADDCRLVRRNDRGALGLRRAQDSEDIIRENVHVGDVPGGEALGASPPAPIGDDEPCRAGKSA